jgi:Tol biopolymer transport system component
VGLATNQQPTLLAGGDYIQASYYRPQSGYGRWLFVTAAGGVAGDIYTVDLTMLVERQTRGREATNAQWSPDGRFITYLNASASNARALHQVTIDTQKDLQIGTGVSSNPAPLWSLDKQHLAYSTGEALSIVNEQDRGRAHIIGPQGHVTALSWSSSNPAVVILGLSDQHKGIYLIDSHNNRVQQVDGAGVEGEIQWSEIP